MPPNPNKPHELRYISRQDIPSKPNRAGTFGWQVRFMRKDVNISRFFSDSNYGGKQESLKVAQDFRNEMEKLYPKKEGKEKYTQRSSKNTSGIVGVVRKDYSYKKKNRPGRYLENSWVAQWTDELGKRRTKSFSIPKYGELGAMILAIKVRREAIEKLSGEKQFATDWGQQSFGNLVDLIETAKDPNEKGSALEELMIRLFEKSKSFSVNGFRTITETEEIDITVLNNSTDPRFLRESAILLVECKNWSSKCGKNEFVIFKEKIENRKSRCSLGFLISWNGFSETITKEMLRGSREQALVIPMDGNDIKRALKNNNFDEVLTQAWDNAIML